MSLSQAWEEQAENWARWARKPGHDSYWQFHRDQFLPLVPPPGARTIDVGCGEGRLTRHLAGLGHHTIGLDASPTLVRLAREEMPDADFRVADAASLPLEGECADLVVAFMSLHDVDDLEGALREIGRVLRPGGCLCAAVVHPLNSAGQFTGPEPDSPYQITGSYLTPFRYSDSMERDGLEMTFHSQHRPFEAYSRGLESAGLVIQALREHRLPDGSLVRGSSERWQRVPLFLHIRALKLQGSSPPEG